MKVQSSKSPNIKDWVLQRNEVSNSTDRMFMTPGYSQDANADNVQIFHGREIRQVPHAAGGMGFVLQLSMAKDDPEGWTPEEVKEYDGWGHDSGRNWRNVDRWEQEGFKDVKNKFGDRAFGLHHRFLGTA